MRILIKTSDKTLAISLNLAYLESVEVEMFGPEAEKRVAAAAATFPATLGAMSALFTCECPDEPRQRAVVVGHDANIVACVYCAGCLELARLNWTGETAAVFTAADTQNPAFPQVLVTWVQEVP